MPLAHSMVKGAIRFTVYVQSRSSRCTVDGLYGAALKVRVKAAPVDGAANVEVVEVIADWLRVKDWTVRIVSGATSRTKVVEVDGVTPAVLQAKLRLLEYPT